MSDKITEVAKEKLNNLHRGGNQKKSNETLMSESITMGEFASRERSNFFDSISGEIMVDLFEQWRNTTVDEYNTREHIYHTALALQAIKDRMIEKEILGKNIKNTGMFKEGK